MLCFPDLNYQANFCKLLINVKAKGQDNA